MGASDTLFLIGAGSVTSVARLPQSHKAFSEAWVRDLIVRAPALLPVERVLSDAGVFLPIGTEVPLANAGLADVLGVTTGGYPVVVETKLWRNPQQRREVLAQTIDYVKEIAKHDYSWFERLWNERHGSASRSLFDVASGVANDELDEVEFIDRIGHACQSGSILAFIVGDGIQHGLTELVAHLGRETSHLRFNLSLLELRCFTLTDDALAVLPTIVREVVPVERAYIRIEPAEELAQAITIRSVAQPMLPPDGKRVTLSEDEFWFALERSVRDHAARQLRDFVDDVQRSAEIETDYKQRAVMLKVPDPAEVKGGASVFAITTDGMAYNSTHGIRQAIAWGLPESTVNELFQKYNGSLHELCPGFPVEGVHHLDRRRFLPVSEYVGCLEGITAAIRDIATALRAARNEG